MRKSYKISVSNGQYIHEYDLPEEDVAVKIGTTIRCDIRLSFLSCREPVELDMTCTEDKWTLECRDGLFFTSTGSSRKQLRKQLEHGDSLVLQLGTTGVEICSIDFSLNFDKQAKKYDRQVDIRNTRVLLIGGNEKAALYIKDDPLLELDYITLSQKQGKLFLSDEQARYGATVNGVKVNGEVEIKDTDFFSVADYSFYYKAGFLYTDSDNGIRINGLRSSFVGIHSGDMEYPKFVRNVRKKLLLSEEEISVLDPPQKPQKPKRNIVLQILPALCSIILIVVLRTLVMDSGGAYVLISAGTMAVGIMTTILTFITGNKDYNEEVAQREKEYADYIKRKRDEITRARNEETKQLCSIYPSEKEELGMMKVFSGKLFDRLPEDDDFLNIRIGLGAKESKRQLKISEKETITVADDLAKIPQQMVEQYRFVRDVPVFVHALDDNAIGIVGDDRRQFEFLKLLTLDLSIRQYQSDLKLYYFLGREQAEQASWLRWLPHVYNEKTGVRNIVYDEESKTVIFEYLYEEFLRREQQKRKSPHIVVLAMKDWGLKMHPIGKYVSKAKDIGVTFIFFEGRQDYLPQGCEEVISLERGDNRGVITQVANLNDRVPFNYSPVRDTEMKELAVAMAPVFSEEVSLENTLTKNITLFELLGIVSPKDIDLEGNWRRAAVYRSLAAPLGVKSKNETVYLDLHEKAHGPHGLVAGTTGSGKSETLQSYIASMAILYHPYEVSFVIIDFKGGGMVNQFLRLPHLIGAITNIDGREIDRSLKSIKAELQKRQKLFAQADVNKIDDYIRLYMSGDVRTPLPHLIIVVDEFAELKAEQPEFMKELISAARIGRSLGIHLILATQKPAGQVSEQIWSNSRFKLCLKVATVQDSNEVLKSPLAAEIREPGRAYLQVGNNEIFELFQSAYSGGPADDSENGQIREYQLMKLNLLGKRQVVFQQKKKESNDMAMTQLDAVVEYIYEHCHNTGLQKLPDICLPALPEILPFEVGAQPVGAALTVPIGLYDDPDNQMQATVELNLTTDNVMIIGSAQTGKTNLLQTIIRGMTERYTPEELTFYIIDFNSMILKNFEQMKHVGGVVTMSEDEALKNLFKLLLSEIATRKEKLLRIGVSSFAAYREAELKGMSQIVLIIDNLTSLKESFLQDSDVLQTICLDGLAVGISVIVANAQTSGIGYKYLSSFATRIGLFCNDGTEYGSLFDFSRMRPLNTPGRCLIEKEKTLYECQTYLAFEGEKEIDRVGEMRKFADAINQRYARYTGAVRIPVIPKTLDRTFLSANNYCPNSPYTVVAGLDYATVSPVMLDLTKIGLLGVSGRSGMGEENFVRYLLHTLDSTKASAPVSVCLLDGMDKRYAELQSLSIMEHYSLLSDSLLEVIGQWNELLEKRYEMLVAGETDALKQEPLLLMLVGNPDAANTISSNVECLNRYKNFFNRFKSLKVAVIFLGMNNVPISFSAPEAIKPLRDSHHFIFFDNLSAMKLFDVPIATMRQHKKEIEKGDCYYTKENTVIKMKTVQD